MHSATLRQGRVAYVLACVFSFLGVSVAHADSITLQWDASPGTVDGYAVYVGSQRLDVGNTTTYTLTTAVAGQQYCFAVSAYNDAGEGAKSGQVCGASNAFPTLTKPANQSSRVGDSVSLQLAGNDPDGMPISYTATGLPPGLFVGSATGFVSGTPSTAGTYSVTAGVSDGVLQSTPQTFSWTVTAAPTPDTTLPLISIATPTASASYVATGSNMSLGGASSDNVGVTSVSWSNSRGGSGSAAGTTSWAVSSIGLQTGTNVITVTARDAAGNLGTDVLTVTYSAPDTTNPGVTISGPTSGTSYAASTSPLTMSGTASDNTGVTQVTWSTDRGASGTASGTTNWTAAGITLQNGANVVTVRARDAAGNQATDVLTVTYTAPDTTNPGVTITGPTSSASYTASASPLTVSGTASDNSGVTQVSWSTDRGASGMASGTTNWTAAGIALQSGTNIVTVTARDAAGNTSTDVLNVTYTVAPSDTTAPAISILGPTSGSSYTTASSVITLGGTSSDAFGVTAVTWSNDRGGSGFSSGTTSWSVPTVTLQSGTNVITVSAQDAAGNVGKDVLTVTYSAPAQTPPPSTSLTLTGQLLKSGKWLKASLQWSQVKSKYMDIYLNGKWVDRTSNDGSDMETPRGFAPYYYKVCVPYTTNCSNTITLK